MISKTKRLLRLPVALAVVVMAGCTESSAPSADASMRDAGVPTDAMAAFDAGCMDGEGYNPVSMMCEPLV